MVTSANAEGCRGMLVVHADGHVECLQECDEVDVLHHDWRTPCDELDEACSQCRRPEVDGGRRRAA